MAMTRANVSPTVEAELAAEIAKYTHDPLGFVMFAYPWGVKGSKLENKDGPEQWQRDLLIDLGNHSRTADVMYKIGFGRAPFRAARASGHGVGKAHALDAVVPTPFGPRVWGSLKLGDLLLGPDGNPVEIRATRSYQKAPMRRVWFDDGSHCDVSTGHLWAVRGRQERRTGKSGWAVMSTAEIEAAGARRSNGRARARQWEIPQQQAANFVGSVLEIDPYVLGLWLGDGGRNSARITSNDPCLIERLKARGHEVHIGMKVGTTARAIGIRGLGRRLRALDVFDKYAHEKRVPKAAMWAVASERADVLRGLLDTDGEATKNSGCIVFSSTSKGLAEDVIWLARSLGGKARMSDGIKAPFYRDKDGGRVEGKPCWRATLRMPHGFRSFYLDRKQERVGACEARYLTRWIDRIEELPDADAMCVEVDGGLYQANDFIVTHNSALVAWVCQWLMSTRPDMRGVVTATTGEQLESKTWPELGKWHDMLINKHWFGRTATSFYFAQYPEEKRKSYSVLAQTVSQDRTEAFAGLHNETGTILIIFDEASGVHAKVWEVAEGAMTDGEVFFLAFGNPTRPDGEFFDCFNKHSKLYNTAFVDSRAVRHTNKMAIQQTIDRYGEESDVAKVRVFGMFPSSSFDGFITTDALQRAIDREIVTDHTAALVMGVDVGRSDHGDPSVIRFRQGRDGRSIKPIRHFGRDTVAFARICADAINKYKPDAVCIDASGPGGGVIDTLRAWGYRIHEVFFGVKLESTARWVNTRSKMYDQYRTWLYEEGAIADDQEMYEQSIAIRYGLEKNTGRIILEPKEDTKERLKRSPDDTDAFVCTFAVPVARRNNLLTAGVHARKTINTNYDEFAGL